MHRLVYLAIAARVVAAVVLIGGPWTDSAAELSGWDVDRFHQMASEPGRHWVDHPVEYPPGSVVVIEAVARVGGVVATHRLLTGLSLLVDLGVAALLASGWGRRAAGAYLLLGLPLVPMGLLRLDLWSVGLAVLGALWLLRRRPWLFAAATTAGALVKIWPALLVPAALALGRWRAALAGLVVTGAAGALWLAYGGWSPEPVEQVVSLRGATGWHLESIGGSLTALFTDARPERQLDAFRIGMLSQPLVLAGRAATLGVVVALAGLGYRATRVRANDDDRAAATRVVALVIAGATAALIVTAPLLSPQFLLWLTPWAALLAAGAHDRWEQAIVWLTAGATVMTGLVLLICQPPGAGQAVPAFALLVRDGLLIGVVVVSLVAIGNDRTSRSTAVG